MSEYIGKHAKKSEIPIWKIPDSLPGNCFHGEIWVWCPHCNEAIEMTCEVPLFEKAGYKVYQCSCGKYFKCR